MRWQLLSENERSSSSLFQFGRQTLTREGFILGLWYPGCLAHMSAALISAGIRIGTYPLARDVISNGNEKQPWHMFLAGFGVGAVGFLFANPFFKAKLRIQSELQVNGNRISTITALRQIYIKESFQGLFKGSSILVLRGALLNSGNQLGYDYTKTICKKHNFLSDGPQLHFTASIMAAFLAVTFCTPADFVLTRFQSTQGKYASVRHCVKDIYLNNSPAVFFTGWTPLFIRLAPLFLINMPLYEQVRKFVGLSYLN